MMNEEPKPEGLETRQLRLYMKLADKSIRLARMYLGALRVLSQHENPDRLALAAHDLRELMEKFPEYVNISIRPPVSMGTKVNELKETWLDAQKSTCRQDDMWGGTIDAKLSKLLQDMDAFFKWKERDQPSQIEKVVKTLRELDPARRRVPPSVEKIMGQLWRTINAYFQAVAHHGKGDTTEEDFEGHLRELEYFLIERIDPRTFDDLDEIDAIISGEK